jgi:hypothetical protein
MTRIAGLMFPRTIVNVYRGRIIALWLLGGVLGVRIMQSALVLVTPATTVANVDGIPLGTYPAGAAQTIVAMYALYALTRLVISVIGVLVLLRYRELVPFMFMALLVNYLAVQVLVQWVPITRSGSPPAAMVTRTLIASTIIGLALSLWQRGDKAEA